MAKLTTFRVADYLNNDETIDEYIVAALEDPDPHILETALADVETRRRENAQKLETDL